MSLVGDIILELRARIPDAPAVLNPPNILSATPVFDPNGGFGGIPQIQIAATESNTWGETQMSPQSPMTITLTPPQNAVDVLVGSAAPPTVIYVNIYMTGSPGYTILGRYVFPVGTGLDTFRIGVPNLGNATRSGHSAGPPLNHFTAFLPDEDGNFLGAYVVYRLLNRALEAMVKIAGGIVDVTGVQSQVNQSMYRMNTPFYQFTNAWYDGYPMDVVQRSMMYLRNSAAGFSGILSYEQDGPQQTIQVWPQSNRTGGQNQLAGSIDAESNFFYLFSGASNFLSIGLAQIDNEIVAYSSVSPASTGPPPFNSLLRFSGVTRGLSGTDQVAHAANAPVTELNIRMSGYRMCKTYNVGDSLQTIMVPQAWEEPLVLHMLSQVRSMEQDDAAAKSLAGDFVQMAEKIAKGSRLGRLKPRQIPIWGQNASDARNVNGIGFGWLIG